MVGGIYMSHPVNTEILESLFEEQVAEIFMEAMTSNNIFPEIWEMSVYALIESHKEFYESPSK